VSSDTLLGETVQWHVLLCRKAPGILLSSRFQTLQDLLCIKAPCLSCNPTLSTIPGRIKILATGFLPERQFDDGSAFSGAVQLRLLMVFMDNI
jgi:hypothetical protein